MIYLHEITGSNNIVSKRFSNGKSKSNSLKLLKVWVMDGQTDYNVIIRRRKILSTLKGINETLDSNDLTDSSSSLEQSLLSSAKCINTKG